MKPRICI
jgi:hypothetical protein